MMGGDEGLKFIIDFSTILAFPISTDSEENDSCLAPFSPILYFPVFSN
jgi:hypothetical protein